MGVLVDIRNNSVRKRIVRRDRIERLAHRVCDGEGVRGDVEISVLLCDDAAIADLNQRYGDGSGPTDVLSFEQPRVADASSRALGDVVISLETAERNCGAASALLRAEVEMLFCHGLLHLLGHDHRTGRDRALMQRKQAEYLGTGEKQAWNFGSKLAEIGKARIAAARRGTRRIGR